MTKELIDEPQPEPNAQIAAVKTLERIGYTYHGAELWKPPLGKLQPEPVAWRFLDKDPLGGKDDRWVYLDNSEFKIGVNPATFNLEPVYTSPPQRKPLTGWQPIETAPRDGTEILMTNGVDVSGGQWFPEYLGTYDQDGASNCNERDAGWMDYGGGMQPDPTHWMSLPTPPIEAAHGIKGDA